MILTRHDTCTYHYILQPLIWFVGLGDLQEAKTNQRKGKEAGEKYILTPSPYL